MKTIGKRCFTLFLALAIALSLLSAGITSSSSTVVNEQFRNMDNEHSLSVISTNATPQALKAETENYLEGYGATRITFNGNTGSLIHLYVQDHNNSSGMVIADGKYLTFDLFVSDVSGIQNIDSGDASCNLIAYSATHDWDANSYGRIYNQQVREMYRNLQTGWNHVVLELEDKTTGDMLWALRLYHTGITIPQGVYMILDDVRMMNEEAVDTVLPRRTEAKNLTFAINDLPEADALQLSDKTAVDAVANAYDALDGECRSLVKNVAKLTAVREKMAALVEENNTPPVIPNKAATFTVDTVNGKKDDVVLVNVNILEEQTEIGSLTLTMQYNPQQLQPVKHPQTTGNNDNWIAPGEILTECSASWMVGNNRFAVATANGFYKNGTLFTAAFQVLREIPEGEIFPISLTVNVIDHCEYYTNPSFAYDVTVIEGGVIPPEDPAATDKAAAAQVTAMIDALNVQSINQEAAVTTAREAYDALTDVQKGYVTNLSKLEEAEAKIEEFKNQAVRYGDIDQNGVVSALDALMVLQAVVGKQTLTNQQVSAADVSGSGTVDATDALNILQFVVGKIEQFPVEQ